MLKRGYYTGLCITLNGMQALAKVVADYFGGAFDCEDALSQFWQASSASEKKVRRSVVILLGRLGVGATRHRALLFKMLADSLRIRCQLLMGRYLKSASEDVAMNLVMVDGKDMLVDLIHAPGRLLPPEDLARSSGVGGAPSMVAGGMTGGGASAGGGSSGSRGSSASSSSFGGSGGSSGDPQVRRASVARPSSVVPLIPGPAEAAPKPQASDGIEHPPRLSIPAAREGSAFSNMSARQPHQPMMVFTAPKDTPKDMQAPPSATPKVAPTSLGTPEPSNGSARTPNTTAPSGDASAPIAKTRSESSLMSPGGGGGGGSRRHHHIGSSLGAVLEQPDLIRLDSGTVSLEAISPEMAAALMSKATATSLAAGPSPQQQQQRPPLAQQQPADLSWAQFPPPFPLPPPPTSGSYDGGGASTSAAAGAAKVGGPPAPSSAATSGAGHRHSQSFDMAMLSSYDLQSWTAPPQQQKVQQLQQLQQQQQQLQQIQAMNAAGTGFSAFALGNPQVTGAAVSLGVGQAGTAPIPSPHQSFPHPQPLQQEGGSSLSHWGQQPMSRSPFETSRAQADASVVTPTGRATSSGLSHGGLYAGGAMPSPTSTAGSSVATLGSLSGTPGLSGGGIQGGGGPRVSPGAGGGGPRISPGNANTSGSNGGIPSPVPWSLPPDVQRSRATSSTNTPMSTGGAGASASMSNAAGIKADGRKGGAGSAAGAEGDAFADLSPFRSVPMSRPEPPFKSLIQQQQELQQERAAAAAAAAGLAYTGGNGLQSPQHSHSRSNDSGNAAATPSGAGSGAMLNSFGSRGEIGAYEQHQAAGRIPSSDLQPVVRGGMVQEPDDAHHNLGAGSMQSSAFGPNGHGQQPIPQVMQGVQQQQQQLLVAGFAGQSGGGAGQRFSAFSNPPGGFQSYEAALAAQQAAASGAGVGPSSPWAQPQYLGGMQLQHQQQHGFPQDPNAYLHQQHQMMQGGGGGMLLGGGGGPQLETVLSRMPDLGIGPNQDW